MTIKILLFIFAGCVAVLLYKAFKRIKRIIARTLNRLAHRFVAIDFETANSSRASACALGLVLFEKGKPLRRDYWLIDPECSFDMDNVNIHHITPDQVKGKPNFKKLYRSIQETFRVYTIVSYSRFDIDVLKESLARYKIRPFSIKFIDVYERTKTKIKGLINYKLSTVAEFFNISGLNHHNALSDAETCGEILVRISLITENEIFATKYPTATPAQQKAIEKLGGHVTPTMLASQAENLIAQLKEEKKALQASIRNDERRKKSLARMIATPPRPSVTKNMMLKWVLEFQQLWNTAADTGDISRESAEDIRGWLYSHRAIGIMHADFISALDSVIDQGEPVTDALFDHASRLVATLGGKPKST